MQRQTKQEFKPATQQRKTKLLPTNKLFGEKNTLYHYSLSDFLVIVQ